MYFHGGQDMRQQVFGWGFLSPHGRRTPFDPTMAAIGAVISSTEDPVDNPYPHPSLGSIPCPQHCRQSPYSYAGSDPPLRRFLTGLDRAERVDPAGLEPRAIHWDNCQTRGSCKLSVLVLPRLPSFVPRSPHRVTAGTRQLVRCLVGRLFLSRPLGTGVARPPQR